MADEFVARLTGRADAETDVEVNLIVTDTTLFGGDDEPAVLEGYGPIPAALARRMVRDSTCSVWVRRLYTRPGDGALIGMDSRRRVFPEALRRWLVVRDQTCRTPWCDAPIRHADHITQAADGGETSVAERAGAVCGVQLRQVDARLVGPRGRRGHRTGRDHHPDRAHLHQPPPPLPGTPRWRSRPPDIIGGSELEHRLRVLLGDAA